MSLSTTTERKVVPAQLGFLAIYNPSLGTTDETVEDQIVYYSNPRRRERIRCRSADKIQDDDIIREEKNEQLRQIGLAQGMVEFGRSFSDGRAVDTVETERSRIILHELEAGWWILASINLTILPGTKKVATSKGSTEEQETTEYSSREVKPAILLLGDLLRAHTTFLLHHASSMSALFVRTRRSKFVGLLGRYWDSFVLSWNVLMHGNPANSLYGGIKISACGELGMGVGEEERGSGEREVLEGFVGRIDGLVDVIVSKFGEADPTNDTKQKILSTARPTQSWLGSGEEPAAEDGAIFLGTGALSRKSLRDVSHWMEDLYKWGDSAYGVVENPSSIRRSKRPKQNDAVRGKKDISPEAQRRPQRVAGPTQEDSSDRQDTPLDGTLATLPPAPIVGRTKATNPLAANRRPSYKRAPGSVTSTESEKSIRSSKFVQYLKLGYGTHWSLGSTPAKHEANQQGNVAPNPETSVPTQDSSKADGSSTPKQRSPQPRDDSAGHFLIGLMGEIEIKDRLADDLTITTSEDPDGNLHESRLVLRTMTVELEREEDARAEADISIDLGNGEKEHSSKIASSEHTGISNSSFESQDRNKTKRLRVVVYASKPFIFVFLFEVQTDALAFSSLYRSLHQQIKPLLKPLATSTSFRASKPDVASSDGSTTPIYDLVWDPKLLTIHSNIPNIPDPLLVLTPTPESPQWSRIEALNTHMQIVNTYIASSTNRSELERTCKTSRGWWVVWTRIPDPEPPTAVIAVDKPRVPGLITEDSMESKSSGGLTAKHLSKSRGASTFASSMVSGPAHPFLDAVTREVVPKDKEIFLIRRASDYVSNTANRFASGASNLAVETGWTSSAPVKLAQGIGVDTKRYIEALLNLNR